MKRQKRKSRRRSRGTETETGSESEDKEARFARMFAKFADKLKERERQIDAQSQDEEGGVMDPDPGIVPLVKSPSMDTVYTPAVTRVIDGKRGSPTLNKIYDRSRVQVADVANVLNKIRIASAAPDEEEGRAEHSRRRLPPPPEINYQEECAAKAKEAAEASIVEAEKLKAQISKPGGKSAIDHANFPAQLDWSCLKDLISEVKDERFFHVVCHVDKTLREKCERGEFVELVKLLICPRAFDPESEEKPYEVVSKNGQTYFAPRVDRDSKISNVRKWEEAFRVYATIYCAAKPERSPEVWQYVETINWAAQRYTWDNVAYYDYTFRRLMAEYPERSWAKTYTHMWKRALVDRLVSKSSPSSNVKTKGVCWRYNKGHCKYGTDCHFEHQCAYCGVLGHRSIHCRKKGEKKNQSRSDNRNQAGDHDSKKKKHQREQTRDEHHNHDE